VDRYEACELKRLFTRSLGEDGSPILKADQYRPRCQQSGRIARPDPMATRFNRSHLTNFSKCRPSSQTDFYLCFSLRHIVAHSADPSSLSLPFVTIPVDVARRIGEPLALLTRKRFLFFDITRWICTWSLDSPGAWRQAASATSGIGQYNIESHYFLPGDWVSPNSVRIFATMHNGTLLCPKSGDVAAVKVPKLRF
jgi:hypothetical protein